MHVRCDFIVKLRSSGKERPIGRTKIQSEKSHYKNYMFISWHFQTKLTQLNCPNSCTPSNVTKQCNSQEQCFLPKPIAVGKVEFKLLFTLQTWFMHRSKTAISAHFQFPSPLILNHSQPRYIPPMSIYSSNINCN